ncbi:hypothetical protein FRUB_03504 [Fimbriiglobus ruber]|uniref:Uncharacterized protein n=1 Tax=Fimbriiglobus ruber TaxID=1908690 RepID=A0A225E5F4_9BACT|nr:hypothetical protein FRUB_03504 [Fimbriiglobus ruber]
MEHDGLLHRTPDPIGIPSSGGAKRLERFAREVSDGVIWRRDTYANTHLVWRDRRNPRCWYARKTSKCGENRYFVR